MSIVGHYLASATCLQGIYYCSHSANCLQEIYLEKNGTSQLGVTLGYDLQTSKGHLYVCEVRMNIPCYLGDIIFSLSLSLSLSLPPSLLAFSLPPSFFLLPSLPYLSLSYPPQVLPTGLAAQDGRLQCGDIIRRVRGL